MITALLVGFADKLISNVQQTCESKLNMHVSLGFVKF